MMPIYDVDCIVLLEMGLLSSSVLNCMRLFLAGNSLLNTVSQELQIDISWHFNSKRTHAVDSLWLVIHRFYCLSNFHCETYRNMDCVHE